MKNSSIQKAVFFFAVSATSFDANLLKKVGECANQAANDKTIYIVKQWHLSPSVNTKTSVETSAANAKKLPQTKNQTQIYEQLVSWVDHQAIDTVIAEGCEGVIDEKLKESFQGWSYADLKEHAKDKNFDEILAHPVVKLKVSHPDAVTAVCGDFLSEIKKSQLALSDARADVAYLSRLSDDKTDAKKLKPYLEGVIEAYHLKPDTSIPDAKIALALDLKKSLAIFEDSTHERNVSFVKKMNQTKSKKPEVLVIGGLHAEDLKKILEEKKVNCVIFEPLAYQNDEESMNSKLKALTR